MFFFHAKLPFSNSLFWNFRLRYSCCHYQSIIQVLFYSSVLLTLLTSLYGCIILPIPYTGKDPFPGEIESFICPGITTKTALFEKLKGPKATRLGGRIHIYAAAKDDLIWLYFIPFGYRGIGEIQSYNTQLIIVEFDGNDVATAFEHFTEETGELKNGLYVVRNGGYNQILSGSWLFLDERLILGASRLMDKEAKAFIVPPNKSAIYYYKSFPDILEILLDDEFSVDSGTTGYLLWVVDPGEHIVSTFNPKPPERLTINCNPGETHYVEHKKGLIRETDKSIAEIEIAKRRLIIDKFITFGFNYTEYFKKFD